MCTTRSWVQILSSHNVSVMNLHDVSVIMTGALSTPGTQVTPTPKPFDLPLLSRGLDGNEIRLSTKSFPLSNMLHHTTF